MTKARMGSDRPGRGARLRAWVAVALVLGLVAPLAGVGPALADHEPTHVPDPPEPAVWRSVDHDALTRFVDVNLNDVDFPTDEIGYAVGDGGTVLKYDANNHERPWRAWTLPDPNAPPPTDPADPPTPLGALNGVHFPTGGLPDDKEPGDLGYAVGDGGVILATVDGAKTWSLLESPTTNDLYGVHFADGQTGYAVGTGGVVLRTEDGGNNWSPTFDPAAPGAPVRTNVRLWAVASPAPGLAYVVGEGNGKPVAARASRTPAGEEVWTSMDVPFTGGRLRNVVFPDPDEPTLGYAVGGEARKWHILKTEVDEETGAVTWGLSDTGPDGSPTLLAIAFDREGVRGQAVGAEALAGPNASLVLTTGDGGESWNPEPVDPRASGGPLHATAFSPGDGPEGAAAAQRLAVGAGGVMLERVSDPEQLAAGLCLPSALLDPLEENDVSPPDVGETPVEPVCAPHEEPDAGTVTLGSPKEGLENPPVDRECVVEEANPEFRCLREFDFAREDGEAVAAPQLVGVDDIHGLRRLIAYGGDRVYLYDIHRLEQRGVPGFSAPFAGTASAAGDTTGVVNLKHSENFREGFGGTPTLDDVHHRLFLTGTFNTLGNDGRPPRIGAVSLTGEFEPTIVGFDEVIPGLPPRVLAETALSHLAVDAERNIVYAVTDGPVVPGDYLINNTGSPALQNQGVTLHALVPSVVDDGARRRLELDRAWSLPLEDRCQRTRSPGSQFGFMGVSHDGRTLAFPCAEVSFTTFGLLSVVPASILNVYLPEGVHPAEIDEIADRDQFDFRSDQMPGITGGTSATTVDGAPESEILHWRAGTRHLFWHYGRREWIGSLTIRGASAVEMVGEDPDAGRLYFTGGEITPDDKTQGRLRFLQTVNPPLTVTDDFVPTGATANPGEAVVDPQTRRFVTKVRARVVVFEDGIEPDLPQGLTDPDAFTHDIDEADAQHVFRRGATKAYGARVWWTGLDGALPGSYIFTEDGLPFPTTKVGDQGSKPAGYTYPGLRGHFLLGPHLSALPWQPSSVQRELFSARIVDTVLEGGFTGALSSATAQAASVDDGSRGDVTARLGGGQGTDSVEGQGNAVCNYQAFQLLDTFNRACREQWGSRWSGEWADARGEPPVDEDGESVDETDEEREEREKRQAQWGEFERCTLEAHDRLLREIDGQWATFSYPDDEDDESPRPCFEDLDRSELGEALGFDEEAQEYDRPGLEEEFGWTRGSRCADPGADDRNFDGSVTACDLEGWRTEASALGGFEFDIPGEDGPAGSVRVGSSRSATQSFLHDDLGMVSEAAGVAGDIEVSIAGGSLRIGEVRARARSWATGRPRTPEGAPGAGSEYDVSYRDVQVSRADGSVAFACGPDGVDVGVDVGDERAEIRAEIPNEIRKEWPPDAPRRAPEDLACDPDEVSQAVAQVFGQTLVASAPERDLEETTTGSPKGAQAIVRRNRGDRSADEVLFNVTRFEVPGLQLTVNADATRFNRVKVDLAAVFVESKYQIGQPKTDPPPGSLRVELSDHAGVPLADGTFAVSGLDLGVVGECTTASDGVGSCRFESLPAGEYEVRQLSAPTGYRPQAGTARVFVSLGSESTASFVNVRNAGAVEVSLVDPGGQPLAGGSFELAHRDSGTAVECTTRDEGACSFAPVPLGSYTLTETAAPEGYQASEPVEFSLERPGQVAAIRVVNGRAGSVSGATVRIIEIIEGSEPTASTTNPSRSFVDALADAFGWLLRHPLQALLFLALFGLLFSPFYGLARRMDLIAAEEAT